MAAPLIFDKYELIRRLAVGGMGEIFLARQTGIAGFDRLVILKRMLPQIAANEHAVDQFLDEARVAATLSHPNIVSIYEVGRWEGAYFIAMEYVHGENLGELLRAAQESRRRIPPAISARIIHDAALGLDHAHRASDVEGRPLRIVHRDVSPQNVMVSSEGVTKVVDFGIAQAANRDSMTATGVVKGKVRYMPPEQVRGEELDHRSDQFALGIVFWEMCTGRRLFKKAKNELETAQNMLTQEIPPPSSVMPGVPAELDRVVLRMLARARADRYPRCLEVAADIDRYLRAQTEAAGASEVAAFVDGLLGPQISERTRDLTPAQENFLITFTTPGREATQARNEPDAPSGAPERKRPPLPLPKPKPRRISLALIALLLGNAGVFGAIAWRSTSRGTTALAERTGSPPPMIEAPIAAPEPLRAAPTATVSTVSRMPVEVPAHAPAEVSAHAPAEVPVTHERETPRAEHKRAQPAAPQPAAEGYLTLSTQPWARVSIRGVSYGSTPIFRLRLPAGIHEVRLTNEAAGIDTTRRIEIPPGDVARIKLELAR